MKYSLAASHDGVSDFRCGVGFEEVENERSFTGKVVGGHVLFLPVRA